MKTTALPIDPKFQCRGASATARIGRRNAAGRLHLDLADGKACKGFLADMTGRRDWRWALDRTFEEAAAHVARLTAPTFWDGMPEETRASLTEQAVLNARRAAALPAIKAAWIAKIEAAVAA